MFLIQGVIRIKIRVLMVMQKLGDWRGMLREKMERARESHDYPVFRIGEPKHFIVLPKLKNPANARVNYPLLEPFVSATIKWDKKEKHLVYCVEEPELSDEDKKLLDTIKSNITEQIDTKMSFLTKTEEAMKYLEKKMHEMLNDMGMSMDNNLYIRIFYYIYRDFIGLNEIEPFMHDPYIEDIGCSGMDTEIYITHRKFGSLKTNIRFTDFDVLTNFVIKLSERCGRYISYAMPLLDGTLPDGSRVQTSLAKDITTKGPTFSIRRFRRNPFSPIDMVNLNTASPSLMAYLWFLIENDVSLLVIGGVSTGKTTMINNLCMFIAPEKKVVSIEDTREINIPHENWIPATTRTGFGVPEASGRRYGEVQLFDLLKESFRMKPDYVVVGEVRGKEAYVLFQGMASGNPSMGTIHSGSVDDVIKRLQSPPIELSPSLIESLDVLVLMVNAREKGKSARRVKEAVEIQEIDSHTGRAHSSKIFSWIPSSDYFKDNSKQSLLLRKISFERGISHEKILEDLKQRREVIEWMQKFGVVQFEEVCSLINLYRRDKEVIMEWVNKGLPPYETKTKDSVKKLWKSTTGLTFAEEKL